MPVRPRRSAAATCAALSLGALALGALPLGVLPLGPAAAAAQPEMSQKVVGGGPATQDGWPAQVALLGADEEDAVLGQFCGGTLIAPAWVLTAAHCLVSLDEAQGEQIVTEADEVEVAVGAYDLRDITAEDRTAVTQLAVHEDYNAKPNTNDVALLHLAEDSSAPLQRVAVPGLEPLQDAGTAATIVGWGSTSRDRRTPEYPPVLQQGFLPLVSDAECAARFDEYPYTQGQIVPELMICAGDGTAEQDGVDTCQGDSGGPLLVADPRGYLRQVGATSFGPTCGNSPTAYSEILRFAAWIEATSGVDLNTYPDTGAAAFEPAVERAALLNVVTGFADGTFGPTIPVTRAQVATMLARALGVTATGEDARDSDKFPDVEPPHRASVIALARLKIVTGFADGTYRPNEPVRRDQMGTLLARALRLEPGATGQFPDLAGNTHEANVGALLETGIVSGFPDNTYRPTLPVARNTMAEFLVRALLSDGEVGIDDTSGGGAQG